MTRSRPTISSTRDDDGVAALAGAGTVAVLLPGAYYFLREQQRPPVESLRRAGVAMAVATDCNPGTSPLTSVLTAMNLAAVEFGLTTEECLVGVTRSAARALGLHATCGTIEPGKWCDLAIWNVDQPAELVHNLGTRPLYRRFWHGQPDRMSDSKAAPARRIAHLDMDAFYASVELLRYPQLRGQPVVIGGRRRGGGEANATEFARLTDYQGRGVVTTATYAAREFGVHSGMGLMQAARVCPQAVLLPADFDEYRRYSRLFKAAIAAIAPRVEDRGIDEVYVDFDAVAGGAAQGGRPLALRIQRAIHEATGLSCSIGVAPNKLLAKLASEFDKPNGITVLHESDLADRASGRCRAARSMAWDRRPAHVLNSSACAPSANWRAASPAG